MRLQQIVTDTMPQFGDVTGETTMAHGITFYKRQNNRNYVWAIKNTDIERLAKAFDLKIRVIITPLDAATEISATGRTLGEIQSMAW